jgi:hypothetical protein
MQTPVEGILACVFGIGGTFALVFGLFVGAKVMVDFMDWLGMLD